MDCGEVGFYDFAVVDLSWLSGDTNGWTHRCADSNAPHISSLQHLGLQAIDEINEGLDVIGELVGLKAKLAHNGVHVATIIISKLNFSSLVFLDDLGDVRGHGAGSWRGHQATWAEYTTEWSDQSHHVWGRDANVELQPSVTDFLGQFFLADFIGTGFFSGVGIVALGKDHDPLSPSNSVWQDHGATHDLVSLLGIDPQSHMDFHGLVKLGTVKFFQLLDSLVERHRFNSRALFSQGANSFR